MRTKPIIYFATAVLLGFAIMMVPRALQTQPVSLFPDTWTENTFNGALSSDDTEKLRSLYGLGQPLNLLPFTLILLIGLVVATGVYVTFKKRLT